MNVWEVFDQQVIALIIFPSSKYQNMIVYTFNFNVDFQQSTNNEHIMYPT